MFQSFRVSESQSFRANLPWNLKPWNGRSPWNPETLKRAKPLKPWNGRRPLKPWNDEECFRVSEFQSFRVPALINPETGEAPETLKPWTDRRELAEGKRAKPLNLEPWTFAQPLHRSIAQRSIASSYFCLYETLYAFSNALRSSLQMVRQCMQL